ncbi:Sphingosine N-acyltransferase lag1 [Neonectria punicea]|uniref:Sphingosine N-acyltransferase lag1 n=1 Tax=Neonectria punicea TaxID=979145 RepID=A0ABR1GNK4_9HYPO
MTDFDGHDEKPILEKLPNCGSTGAKSDRNPGYHAAQNLNLNLNRTSYIQTVSNGNVVRRVRRESDGARKFFASWMLRNQIGLSFNLLALLFLAHFIPKARPHTIKFFTLSYRNPDSGKYGNGSDDVYPIVCLIVLFTGLRAAVMEYLLVPFAKMWGVRKIKDLTRFSEQSWLMCYYAVSWTMGMYIYYTSPYWLNNKELWTNWPDRELNRLDKFYILAQWAFWLQQIIVINIEERRKDHTQMLAHHFVTCGLIYACYAYHQTRVGNLILVLMDFVDIVLPLAKCLKYMGFKLLCDAMFGVFLVSWVFTRHIVYCIVCWSIYADIPGIIGETCFRGPADDLQGPLPIPEGYRYMLEPFWNPQGLVCFGRTVTWSFLAPLLLLQGMNMVWFAMIVRVALKVIRREGAEDNRSDDEGEKED